ncbi:unnamed protein product, partial [Cylicostephanus goldi]
VATGTQEKKRIINEITQQFLRTFRLSNGKNKENGIDARTCAADLSRTNCLIASRLVSSSHEYMEEMVREYMRSARERFLSAKQVTPNWPKTYKPIIQRLITYDYLYQSILWKAGTTK